MEPLTEEPIAPPETPTTLLDGLDALVQSLAEVRAKAARVTRAHAAQEIAVLRAQVPALVDALGAARGAAAEAGARLAATPLGATLGPDYPAMLEAELRRANVEFEGAFPEYEVFPLTVRVNPDAETVRIGRKVVAMLAPRALARAVQAELRRLQRSSFQAERFLKALALCYDALSGGESGATVPLVNVYRLLSARTGAAGYTRQEFAFDIYRLRRQSELVVDERTVEFVHGKKGPKIVVPRAQGGAEEFTAMRIAKAFEYA